MPGLGNVAPTRAAGEGARHRGARLARHVASRPAPGRAVARGTLRAMRSRWLAAVVRVLLPLLCAGGGACAGRAHAPEERIERGLVVIAGLPDETIVRVDDASVGTLADFPIGLPLRAGTRRIELRVPQGLTWRMEMEVRGAEVQEWHLEAWPAFEGDDDSLVQP